MFIIILTAEKWYTFFEYSVQKEFRGYNIVVTGFGVYENSLGMFLT